jgi:hypothetical protein
MWGVLSYDGSYVDVEGATLYGYTSYGNAFVTSVGSTIYARYASVTAYYFAYACVSTSGCIWDGLQTVSVATGVTLYQSGNVQSAVNIISGY